MGVNFFSYGSLVSLKEWEKMVQLEGGNSNMMNLKCDIADIIDCRWERVFNLPVNTRECSRFYQNGKSSMLNLIYQKTCHSDKPINGRIYYDLSQDQINAMLKRENLYKVVTIKVKTRDGRIYEAISVALGKESNTPINIPYFNCIKSAFTSISADEWIRFMKSTKIPNSQKRLYTT